MTESGKARLVRYRQNLKRRGLIAARIVTTPELAELFRAIAQLAGPHNQGTIEERLQIMIVDVCEGKLL
jgi:hypothetical protein